MTVTVHNGDSACTCALVGQEQEAEGEEIIHTQLFVKSYALTRTVMCVKKVVLQVGR